MVILASSSPRRHELMGYVTPNFKVDTLPTDESLPDGTDPRRGAELIALRKARAVAALHPEEIVVGADTVVAVGGEVFGKPKNAPDAVRMLETLSGQEHIVYTGVAIVFPGGERIFSEATSVRFAPLTEREIAAYIATGDPMDKAGAYGIQGSGSRLVAGITGDFYNVMGLPVCRLWREFTRFFPDICE